MAQSPYSPGGDLVEAEVVVVEIPAGLALKPRRLGQLEADGTDADEVVGEQPVGGRRVAVALGGGPGGEKVLDVGHVNAPATSPPIELPVRHENSVIVMLVRMGSVPPIVVRVTERLDIKSLGVNVFG